MQCKFSETAEKSTNVKLTESVKSERSETPTPSDTTPNNEPDSSEGIIQYIYFCFVSWPIHLQDM